MERKNHLFLMRLTIISALIFIGIFSSGCSLSSRPATRFATPEDALNALNDAVASRSVEKADAVFGSDGEYILHTGDPVEDNRRGQKFVRLFEEKHQLKALDENNYLLTVGKKDWPFPVPLTKTDKGWYFDAASGREEILTRTIGKNELIALDVARATYLAQRRYALADWDGDGVKRYAKKFISTPGARDGLYWPAAEGEDPSPLGPTIVKAADENYTINPDGAPKPYHGYFYKIYQRDTNDQTAVGALSKPGSYWMVSYPAAWGKSGIMTFAMNERGWIFEKDFNGDRNFENETKLIVDHTWTRVE